jgi:hypothetical protein
VQMVFYVWKPKLGGGGSGAPDVLVDERMERGGPQKC